MTRSAFGQIRKSSVRRRAAALVQFAPRETPRDPGPSMNLADYLVIAAVVVSAAIGAVRGFLREAIALVTLVLALFLAWHFADLLEPHLGGLLSKPPAGTWAARAIIFILVLLGVFVILGQLLRLDDEHWWQKSRLLPYGEGVANGLRAIVGEQLAKHGGSLSASNR